MVAHLKTCLSLLTDYMKYKKAHRVLAASASLVLGLEVFFPVFLFLRVNYVVSDSLVVHSCYCTVMLITTAFHSVDGDLDSFQILVMTSFVRMAFQKNILENA